MKTIFALLLITILTAKTFAETTDYFGNPIQPYTESNTDYFGNYPSKETPSICGEVATDMFEQRALGWDFNEGKGVEKDYQKAACWFKKAALQGDIPSQRKLGYMYTQGKGVEKDYDKAIVWLKKAALQGDKKATGSVGHLYKNKKKDYQKAIYWYNKAILLNHAGAATQLGHMHRDGWGFKKDINKAIKWYKRAAEQGNHHGQRNLGLQYLKGQGVDQDNDKAYYWFNKAALQGNKKAVKDILKMRNKGHIPKKRSKEVDYTLSKSSDSKLELTPKSSSGFLKGCKGSTGTGFVVSQSGYVATAQHVVRTKNDCKCDIITVDGVKATVVLEDKESDTALIKVNKNYKNFASITDRPVKWMDPIYVFGWPNIAGLSFNDIDGTEGIVKGLKGETDYHFRISNDIQPGSSGGPIVNRDDGRVVGIVSSSFDRVYVQNVNFGNRVARLRNFMKQEKIIASNRVSVIEQSNIPEFYNKVTKAITCSYNDDLWP